MLEYSRLINDRGEQISEKLERQIKRAPEEINYNEFFRNAFYGVSYTDYLFSLPNTINKVIVYYVDIVDEAEIQNFIREDDSTTVQIELRDLKTILDDVIIGDYTEFHMEETSEGYKLSIDKFLSDRVLSKIAEFNQKACLNSSAKKPYKPIEVSEEGLELIEFLSIDSTKKEGEWHSDSEIKIDKNGYVIINGTKTKEFWNGCICSPKKSFRIKIRNICGDETIWKV